MRPLVIRNGVAVFVEEVNRIQEFAVDVELQVMKCAVADSNRTRTFIALEMIEDVFGQIGAPVDAIDDLQRTGSITAIMGPFLQPIHEGRGFAGESDPE